MRNSVLDRGHPSVGHRLLVGFLRRKGAAQHTASLAEELALRDANPAAAGPAPKVLRGVHAVPGRTASGWPLWTLSPHSPPGCGVIVAVHGGGYFAEASSLSYRRYADLVRRTGATVLVPGYPLIPGGDAATAVPALADLIAEQTTGRDRDQVSVLAESAGAGLALASCQELVRRGGSTPGHLVLISPWLDVTLGDPRSDLVDEPLLNRKVLTEAGERWANGLDPHDPRVSPLFGDLRGLPRTSVYSGTLDVLHPDALRLRERAETLGIAMRFHFGTGLSHAGYVVPVLPEYRAMLPRLIADLGLADHPR